MKIEITNAKKMKLSEKNNKKFARINHGVIPTDCNLSDYGNIIDLIVRTLGEHGIIAKIELHTD